jgi:creatinine amidohydrolase
VTSSEPETVTSNTFLLRWRNPKIVYPEDLTWPRLEDYSKGDGPLLLPIGSVESHGAHLPISTDSLIASHISDQLAKRNSWISLPPVAYSIAVPSRIGNVGISKETLGGYLKEIIQHFVDFGHRRFILILGHGGPDMKSTIGAACESVCGNHRISIHAYHILKVLEDLDLVNQATDRHAGEWETSLMLFLHNEVVGDIDQYDNAEDIERFGVFGDPKKASKAEGAEHLGRLIKHIEDDIKPRAHSGFECNWQVDS